MKYSFITQHKNTYPVSLQCRVLGVSRQGYYHDEKETANKEKTEEHQEMLEWIKDIALVIDFTYGSHRMQKALNALGYPVSRNKARKLMKEAGISVRRKKKYKLTTDSNHKKPLFDNVLKRQFDVKTLTTSVLSGYAFSYGSLLKNRVVVSHSLSSGINTIIKCKKALPASVYKKFINY